MAQLLAIEWDTHEARIAVGRGRGKELVIEHAFAIKLKERDESSTEQSVGTQIAQELRSRGIGRVETLVAVGRANIELKQLNLPPAPEEELPELVRFQALRQFTTIAEDWPLDFVRASSTEADSISVLAAVISPDLVSQIRKTCDDADLQPKRLILRPFAGASLLRRHDRGVVQPCRLMLDLLTEEADLTVLDGEHLLLTRTVRLHSSDAGDVQARGLLGEIRRTIAAANNQLKTRRVEKVILCGDGSDHATIKQLIEQELTLETELFDPFAELGSAGLAPAKRPDHSGRFAPLLGMLFDEATGTPPIIDFLHPRKKPEKANLRRRNTLIAATVGTMCLVALLLVWMQLSSLDQEANDLRAQAAQLKKQVVAAEKTRKEELLVQSFLDRNINLLDEFDTLSQRLPSADKVLVTQLNFAVQPETNLRIEGFTGGPSDFHEIEKQLRAADRPVKSNPKANDLKREKYKYGFAEIVKVPPRGQSQQNGKSKPSTAPSVPTAAGNAAATQLAVPEKVAPQTPATPPSKGGESK
jgi:Tfp pilus assembly PilM family ATPase